MPVKKRLEYAIQATASVWEPFEQVHSIVSGEVNFDSFGMAPWDAGGIHGDSCQPREMLRTHAVTVVNAAVVPTNDYERT